uniref:Uncharacterized protein n=2 Tax=unclassified bacterial viruses TaxID=12333 RepID=A0AAU6VXQ7_9VIRU
MRYISKQFLSPCAHETGSIVCQVETPLVKNLYVGYKDVISPDLDGSVWFRACHGEPVKLDFNASSQKDFDKRITKLDLMIEELTKMRGQMTEMWYSHLRDIEYKTKQLEDESK